MTVEEMRDGMRRLLDAEPIPDDALARYATLVDGLTETVRRLARELAPEDEAGAFLAHLEQLAPEATDGR